MRLGPALVGNFRVLPFTPGSQAWEMLGREAPLVTWQVPQSEPNRLDSFYA